MPSVEELLITSGLMVFIPNWRKHSRQSRIKTDGWSTLKKWTMWTMGKPGMPAISLARG